MSAPPESELARHEEVVTAERRVDLKRSLLKLGLSLAVLVVVFAVVLPRLVDYGDMWDAIGDLGWREVVVLLALTVVRWLTEGSTTAAVMPHLGTRRGAVAYLSSAAVASTIPGPVDLAVRYGMYRAWGFPFDQATAGVVANGVFTTFTKLGMPVLGALFVTVTVTEAEGFGRYALLGLLALTVAITLLVVLVRSERHAQRLGDWIGRRVSKMLRWFGKPPVMGLGDRLVAVVRSSGGVLRSRWPMATATNVLATFANFAVLLAAIRFAGVPNDELSWAAIFAAMTAVGFLTVVPITSGNVGVTELVYIGVLGALSGEEYAGALAGGIVVYRLFTWLLVIPVGWATLGVWEVQRHRRGLAVRLPQEVPSS